jgi:hypothetical protein
MRILCAIVPPEAIVKILDCLGHPSKPPPCLRLKASADKPILPTEPDRDPEFFFNYPIPIAAYYSSPPKPCHFYFFLSHFLIE